MDEKSDDRFSKIIDEAIWLRLQELWRQFFAAPESERAAIMEEINALRDNSLKVELRMCEMAEFAHRLATRQGTVTPDFDSLYEAKAELDRKLSERDG
jgi:hypothetical protein